MVIGCESTSKKYKQVTNFDLNIEVSPYEDCETHGNIYEIVSDCTFFLEPVNRDGDRNYVTLRCDHQFYLGNFFFLCVN